MAIKPTKHVCVTPEGLKRKRQRLITQLLMDKHPMIYDQLWAEAEQTVMFDQLNPYSTVVTSPGERKVHDLTKAAANYKTATRRQAIDERYYPKFFGVLAYKGEHRVEAE